MGVEILKYNKIKMDQKSFHKLKEPIDLLSVDTDQIVVSDRFKHNNEGCTYMIGYRNELVNPLCIILSKMSGYIRYFESGGRNMSSLIKGDEVWNKYYKIWDVIKNKLGITFHSEPVYEYKYSLTKVREFDRVIKTKFGGNGMPNENMYYTCIACVTIHSVINFDQKNHPQVYLQECKYRMNKTQLSKFIRIELKSDSDLNLDSEVDSKSDAKLMAKLEKSSCDSQ